MKSLLFSFSIALIIIFGGVFLVHLIRDSEFLVAEFIGAIVGILIMSIIFMKQRKAQ